MMSYKETNLKHNYLVNILDGAFFGLGMSFASLTTIVPLFVSTLTDSALLIGLIPAIHTAGWQIPQLLMAKKISGLSTFKPHVLMATIHERLPFILLAFVALFSKKIGVTGSLILTYLLLIWQGLGAGITANSWQNMIGKLIPADIRATFFAIQSSAANLLASGGAILAGLLLEKIANPYNFAACFGSTAIGMSISWFFLYLIKEEERPVSEKPTENTSLLKITRDILSSDKNFSWFLISRMLTQFGLMSFSFYIVYGVSKLGMTEIMAGLLTSTLFIVQVIANPILGKVADRFGSKVILEFGAVCMVLSIILILLIHDLDWFFLIFIFAGLANTSFWTIGLALTLEFGTEELRPTYVGLANTLIAPTSILAPIFGGVLADSAGYQYTFLFAVFSALITLVCLHFFVKNPRQPQSPVYLK